MKKKKKRKGSPKRLFPKTQLEKQHCPSDTARFVCCVSTASHAANNGCDSAVEWRAIRPSDPCSQQLRAEPALQGAAQAARWALMAMPLCNASHCLLDRLLCPQSRGSPAPQKCALLLFYR